MNERSPIKLEMKLRPERNREWALSKWNADDSAVCGEGWRVDLVERMILSVPLAATVIMAC